MRSSRIFEISNLLNNFAQRSLKFIQGTCICICKDPQYFAKYPFKIIITPERTKDLCKIIFFKCL